MPEHPDTKSVIARRSSSQTHDDAIILKLRSFGRSNNRRATWLIPWFAIYNSRDPVSLGEARGGSHSSAPPR